MKDDFREDSPVKGGSDEGGGEIIGNNILIPPGDYIVRYLYYATSKFQDQSKVTLYFAVIEHDTYAGTPLERFYNVDSLKGPQKRYGDFRATARGDLVRELSSLIGPMPRLDRISPVHLKDKRILCEVKTVTEDRNRRPLTPDQQYSCISRLLEVLPDEDW